MPVSLHSHSGQFCSHATGDLLHVVLAALARGFELYGLSEHVPRHRQQDLYPDEDGLSPLDLGQRFADFVVEAHRLRERYADRITLLVGLETEYITDDDLDHLDALLREHAGRIDYLVGSVHHVDAVPIDFDLASFDRALHRFAVAEMNPMDGFLSAYFDAQYRLLHRFHPEIIGHIDLCRLYHPGLRFSEFPNAFAKLNRNVKYAIHYGALFEVNAAALRKGWHTPYPGHDVARLIRDQGGRFTLSDDSHAPSRVGEHYHRVRDYLRRLGVDALWYLAPSPGRRPTPTRLPGDWWEHPFWNRCAPSPPPRPRLPSPFVKVGVCSPPA